MKNKIGIIGIRGLPAKYGAFDTFVDQLVNSQAAKSRNSFFVVSCDLKFRGEIYNSKNVKRIFIFRGNSILILLNYLISIFFMLLMGVRKFIFFGYGAAFFFPLVKLFNGKIICNPDGIEWRRPEGRIKKLFFKFCEKMISSQNITKIFDSKVIQRYYKIKHKSDGKVAYYPSGFEEKKKIIPQKKKFERFYILGRLLEENNTSLIVKAFSKIEGNKKLFIIGNRNKYFETKIIPIINKSKNIYYLGSIYNRDKLFKLCCLCDCYIHGHSVGGTNPTLIEAVNIEKKIISYKTFFNKEILGKEACYFQSEEDLIRILNSGEYKTLKSPKFSNFYRAELINKIYLDSLD